MGRGTTGIRATRPPRSRESGNTLSSWWDLNYESVASGTVYMKDKAGITKYLEVVQMAWKGEPITATEWDDYSLADKVDMAKNYGLTIDEFTALYAYTGDGYRALNEDEAPTWAKGPGAQYRHQWKKALNRALDKLPDWNGPVIRNTRRTNVRAKQIMNRYEFARELGDPISYDRFNSSSTDGKFNTGSQLQYIIQSTKGKNIRSLARHSGENEVLFKSNAQFLVEKVEVTRRAIVDTKAFKKGDPQQLKIFLVQVD